MLQILTFEVDVDQSGFFDNNYHVVQLKCLLDTASEEGQHLAAISGAASALLSSCSLPEGVSGLTHPQVDNKVHVLPMCLHLRLCAWVVCVHSVHSRFANACVLLCCSCSSAPPPDVATSQGEHKRSNKRHSR